MDNSKKYTSIIVALLCIGASFFGGYWYGYNRAENSVQIAELENAHMPSDVNVDFGPFWKAWQILDERFVPAGTSSSPTDINSSTSTQNRVWGAIVGMVKSLGDPYTVFFPPVETKIFESDINGNFEGVGMEIGIRDDILTVIAPLKGTPAYRAGVLSGDKILKIDDHTTENLSTEEAVRLIRGPVGTKVTLTLIREEQIEPFEIVLTRAVIDIPTIDTELRKDGIFVIRLYNFSAISTNLFRTALREFIKTGSNKLILDLRGNPGGYLEAAVDMASWFLPTGDVIVKEDFRKSSEQVIHRSYGYNVFKKDLKMVILIDGGSASASEILAGALREHNVAELIGVKSFGKGSVQELTKVTPSTSLKVTVARWLTPDGNSISAGGLTPDIVVERTRDDVKNNKDPQLEKAVEFLIKK